MRRGLSTNAFLCLLEYDLMILAKSWIVRFWFGLTVVGGVVAVIVSRNFIDDSSFLMGWGLVLYLGFGSLIVLANSVSAISQEFRFLGESIISRGIAPTPYLLAKLVSRSAGNAFMFLIVVAPTALLMRMMALNNDMTIEGILVGLAYWVLLITVLSFMGITVSVLVNNTMLGLVVLGVIWYMGLGILDLAYADGFSPEGVLGNLPLVLQGKSLSTEVTVLVALGAIPILILPLLAIKLMNSRDL
jgi:hypothetical protein